MSDHNRPEAPQQQPLRVAGVLLVAVLIALVWVLIRYHSLADDAHTLGRSGAVVVTASPRPPQQQEGTSGQQQSGASGPQQGTHPSVGPTPTEPTDSSAGPPPVQTVVLELGNDADGVLGLAFVNDQAVIGDSVKVPSSSQLQIVNNADRDCVLVDENFGTSTLQDFWVVADEDLDLAPHEMAQLLAPAVDQAVTWQCLPEDKTGMKTFMITGTAG